MKIDNDLAIRLQSGDENAYQEVYNLAHPVILQKVFGMVGNRQDAEDLTQEILLKVWQRASDWTPKRCNFTTWMFSVVRNSAIDFIRKESRDKRIKYVAIDEAYFAKDRGSQAIDDMISHEQILAIEKFLCSMKDAPRQRLAWMLYRFEGYTVKDIACIMNLAHGTVKTHIRTANQKIRTRLEEIYE